MDKNRSRLQAFTIKMYNLFHQLNIKSKYIKNVLFQWLSRDF